MHIILGVLGSVVTILVLANQLSRLGVDVGWLNPSSWARRRKWQKKYYADPAFSLESPMEAVAGLLYVMAKASGEITREQKECILELFETEFRLDERQTTELLSSSSFLIKDEDQVIENLKEFMQPSIEKFDDEKRESTLHMLEKVALCEGDPSYKQLEFMTQVKSMFQQSAAPDGKW